MACGAGIAAYLLRGKNLAIMLSCAEAMFFLAYWAIAAGV
jgi:hypothetical protein